MEDIEFTETETLRQGDVIQRRTLKTTETRIVITTNCDIQYNKHREVITTVYLMNAIDYVRSFVLYEELSKCCEQLRERLINEKNTRKTSKIQIRKISEERFLEWIVETGPSSELNSVFLDWPELAHYRNLLLATESEDRLTIEQMFPLFESFREIGIGKSAKNLAQHVDNKLKSPPGDFVFLAGGACLRDSFGYIAHLRDIAIIAEHAIQLKNLRRQVNGIEHDWQRVAKVKEYFLHHMLQRFGLVFGSIGMPSEFEERQNSSRELISEFIRGGF